MCHYFSCGTRCALQSRYGSFSVCESERPTLLERKIGPSSNYEYCYSTYLRSVRFVPLTNLIVRSVSVCLVTFLICWEIGSGSSFGARILLM